MPQSPIALLMGDDPTTCPSDSARTEPLGYGTDANGQAYITERCPVCQTVYHLYDEASSLAA